MERRGVLIVSASTGTGHARAGEAMREAIRLKDPEIPVQHVDLLSLAPSWVRAMYGGGYELMATRAPWLWHRVYNGTDGDGWDRARWSSLAQRLLFKEFRNLLLDSRWQLCLSTHFLPCQLAAGKPDLPPFALAITDFTLHRYWVQPGVRQYFVATDELARQLKARVPRAQVHATGIPIAPTFAAAPSRVDARAGLGIDVRRPVALVMGGGLGLGVSEMVEAALAGAHQDVQVIAVCGKNAAAAERLRGLGVDSGRLRVESYVTDIERYISAADIVVTKPGGLTASEALACGRPLLVTRPIPGQETGNTRALVAAGAAIAALTDTDITHAMRRLFAGDGLLSGLAAAASRLGRARSAAEITSLLDVDASDRRVYEARSVAAPRSFENLPLAG